MATTPVSAIQPTPTSQGISLEPQVLFYSIPVDEAGLTGQDQYECRHFSNDMSKCLDGPNDPIQKTWKSTYGPPNPEFQISSHNLGNGYSVTVAGHTAVSQYADAVQINVVRNEIWQAAGVVYYNQKVHFLIGFRDGIWYFRFHY